MGIVFIDGEAANHLQLILVIGSAIIVSSIAGLVIWRKRKNKLQT